MTKLRLITTFYQLFLIADHMYKHIIDVCDDIYVINEGKTHLITSVQDIELLGYARV
jgi:ABC-type lipopolysaccharide export system ATPase subunit